MGMSDADKQRYLDEITPMIEAAADVAFKRDFGYTYRGNDVPPRRAEIPHRERNGDGHPTDSLARIKRDFPDVFGETP